MIRSITIAVLASLMIFTSCGDNKKAEKEIKTDSVKSEIPAELKAINEKLLKSPNDPELYNQRAKYFVGLQAYNDALTDMTRAINMDSSKADYYLTISNIYFAVNRSGEAKKALEKCISLEPENTEAILKLAELYLYVRKNEKSIELINQALRKDKYNAKAYFLKGMNFKEMKDTARAISSMNTAVEQDQQYYNAYMQLGLLTAAQGNKVAVEYYKNALRIQPKSSEAWYDLGKFYQDIKDYDNAIGTYTTLLTFENNLSALYNMGVIHLVGLKQYSKALEYFTAAINVDPKYVEAYYGRGLCYRSMNDPKKAAAEFQTCLSLNPDYAPAKVALGKM